MLDGIPVAHWGGAASACLGGCLWLLSWTKGRQARQLEGAHQVDRLAELAAVAAVLPRLVAVRGRATSDEPLSCELCACRAVISQVTEEQHCQKFVGGEWVNDVQPLRASTREAHWAVADASGVRLPVLHAARRADELPLELAADLFVKEERSALGQIVDQLKALRILGRRQREHILAVGTPVTAVGELAAMADPPGGVAGTLRAPSGGALVLQAPTDGGPFIISTRSLADLIASLDRFSRVTRYFAVGFTLFGASLMALQLARGARAWLRRRALRRRVEEAAKRRAEAAASAPGGAVAGAAARQQAAAGSAETDGDADADRSPDLCVICLERPCGVVFTACGHMCACVGCSKRLAACPICRARCAAIRVYRT